jgi:membrane-associated protein
VISAALDISDLAANSPRTYLAIVGLVTLDAVLPIAPSETLLVAAGVEIAQGPLSLPLVIAAGTAGALIGHSLLFALGILGGPGLRGRLFNTPRGAAQLAWAERALRDRTWILIVSDFVPIGRTATMFAAGALGVAPRRFYAFVVPGAVLWASFYTLLGLAGGSVFEQGWQALAASISAALLIAAAGEAAHRLRRRSRPLSGAPPSRRER